MSYEIRYLAVALADLQRGQDADGNPTPSVLDAAVGFMVPEAAIFDGVDGRKTVQVLVPDDAVLPWETVAKRWADVPREHKQAAYVTRLQEYAIRKGYFDAAVAARKEGLVKEDPKAVPVLIPEPVELDVDQPLHAYQGFEEKR